MDDQDAGVTRVVLVEDDKDTVEFLVLVLERRNCDVAATFTTAEAAQAWMGWSEVDVAVVDWNLPGENGGTVLTWLEERYPGVQCIIATAHEPSWLDLDEYDGVEVISKPFIVDRLARIIRRGGNGG